MRNERKINLANCNFNFQNKNSPNTNEIKAITPNSFGAVKLQGNSRTAKQASGITLIALVVTIVVLLILASVSISTVLGNNGIIPRANEAKVKTDLANIQEEFRMYVMDKTAENGDFSAGTLAAGSGENTLYYNTKPDSETGSIRDILKSSTAQKYLENFEIIKGDLIYASQNAKELEWAQEVGLAINPYLIINGELISSETNLMLIDKATGTLTVPEKVTKIGAGAFRGENLRTIIIPETVEEIADYAFSGNTTLENVIIEEPKTEGKGLKTIGAFAFQNCSAIREISIANTVSKIGESCFHGCSNLAKVNITTGIKVIPLRMFSTCLSLTEISIPEGITTIEDMAFEGCRNIKKITIPTTVTKINGGAFIYCNNLGDNIEIKEGNETFVFENGFLMSKDRKRVWYVAMTSSIINIPDTVETLEGRSLCGESPTSVSLNISESVRAIKSTFSYKIKSVNVDPNNNNYASDNGNLYNKNMTTLIRWFQSGSSAIIPSTVIKIKAYAFDDQSINSIILPEGLETIEEFALHSTSITHLNLPKSAKIISNQASNFTVSVPEENNYYSTASGEELLSKNGKILYNVTKASETYTIPSTVTQISNKAFYRRPIKQINIPSNVTSIDDKGFDYCEKLEKVEISSNIQSIGVSAFSRCDKLKEIIIHKKEGEISNAPWGCPYGLRAVKWD